MLIYSDFKYVFKEKKINPISKSIGSPFKFGYTKETNKIVIFLFSSFYWKQKKIKNSIRCFINSNTSIQSV